MVEVAFVRVQQSARVLAAVAVTLADVFCAELGALLRHFGKVHRHDDGRHTNHAVGGAHGVVTGANWQLDPLAPSDGTDVAIALDVECRSYIRGHLAERIRRRANVNRLPVAVEHEHDGLV